jgi:dolichol-phosphate mannosyltransferase
MSLISVVIPVYNEQECIRPMFERLAALPCESGDRWEYIFVDDGSRDGTLAALRELSAADGRVKYVSFSRNFGHEAALTAGLDHAEGDAVVTLDGDLQHPPEAIPKLLAAWREGNQIVYARRESSEHLPALKAFLSRTFYKIIRKSSRADIPADTANFRLMDRRAVQQFRRLREQARFGRALVAWTGFRQAFVPYREEQRFAGQTKYTTWKSALLAMDAFISFTDFPLRLGTWAGAAFLLTAVVLFLVAAIRSIAGPVAFGGVALILSAVFFVGGTVLMTMGVLGAYVGRIYRQSQDRPLYVVGEKSASLPAGEEGATLR